MGKVLLTRAETAIEYFFLRQILTTNTNVYLASQKELAKEIGFHENSVGNALVTLEKRGWIKRYKDGFCNVIEFNPPKNELHRRLSYCSEHFSRSLTDEEYLSELEEIKKKFRNEITELQKKIDREQKQEAKRKNIVHTITDGQIGEFVDSLIATITNQFDKRTPHEKVKGEIRKFQRNLGLSTSNDSDTSVDNNDSDFKPRSVVQGYREILQMTEGNRSE